MQEEELKKVAEHKNDNGNNVELPGGANLQQPQGTAALQPQKPIGGGGNDAGSLDGKAAKTEETGSGAKTEEAGSGAKTEETGSGAKTEETGSGAKTEEAGKAPQQANDVYDEKMGNLMAQNLDKNYHGGDAKEEAGDAFDKLEDLVAKKKRSRRGRRAKQEDDEEKKGDNEGGDKQGQAGTGQDEQGQDKSGQANTPQDVKKEVDKLRGGQLYTAVVLARQLERGGQNPMADNKFKGFFNSSGFNSAADKIKLVGGISSTAGMLDATFKSSVVAQAIGLANNLVGFVTSIKSLIQKLKGFKKTEGKLGKILGLIGILADFAMVVSKAAAIVQSIATFAGQFKDALKNVVGYITTISNSISQIGGIITGVNGLKGAVDKRKKMEALRDKRGEEVDKIYSMYTEPGWANDADDWGGDVKPKSEDADKRWDNDVDGWESEEEEKKKQKEKKKRRSLKEVREQRNQRKAERNERRAKANMLLKQENVAQEDKDKLLLYLASCRKAENIKSSIIMGASGLVANAIGLGSSIATGVSYTGDEKATTASKHLGILGGFAGIGVSAAKLGIDKKNQKKQNNEETEMIKGRLWGHIHGLDDNKYGLKGISESLEADPSPEKAAEAKGVIAKYKSVDEQLTGAFVEYGTLFKAKNAEEFRNLLVSGI